MKPLLAPLTSVEAYVAHFSHRPLPVLRKTARELDQLRAQPEQATAKALSSIVLGDPLLTMRLLVHLQTHRSASRNADINTIERAVMMIGINPFLRLFAEPDIVEDLLAEHPRALLGVLRVIGRARRAASLARTFAILRHDLDVQEITVAALLNEATEIVCWIYAPTLTGQVYALQLADRGLRSAVAQRQVFGVTAAQLQLGLIEAWRLPDLLVQLLDHRLENDPRVKTVSLAARIARHLARGWDDAGLPDDIRELEALTRVPRSQLLKRLGAPAAAEDRLMEA